MNFWRNAVMPRPRKPTRTQDPKQLKKWRVTLSWKGRRFVGRSSLDAVKACAAATMARSRRERLVLAARATLGRAQAILNAERGSCPRLARFRVRCADLLLQLAAD